MNNSKFYQIENFYPHLKNPQKYVGKIKKITCRSSWEIKFCQFCDRNDSIISWSSEEVVISYFYPVDNKWHRYFTDFYMKVKKEDGSIKEFIVEIKPFAQCNPPSKPKRVTKGYINSVNTFIKNQAKWDAAKKFCESEQRKGKNIEFTVITEKDGLI